MGKHLKVSLSSPDKEVLAESLEEDPCSRPQIKRPTNEVTKYKDVNM